MLELGGKSPVVLIYSDADLDKAIFMAAMGIFVHSGQGVCAARGSSSSAGSTTGWSRASRVADTMKLGAAQRKRVP